LRNWGIYQVTVPDKKAKAVPLHRQEKVRATKHILLLKTVQYLTELFSQPAGTIILPFNT